MYWYLTYILVLLLLPGMQSCSRFEEFNTDPDNPEKVPASMLATGLILGSLSNSHIGKDFLYKDMLAKYISYMEGATNYQYNLVERTDFYSLLKLSNVEKMNEAAKGGSQEDSYVALGHFIRALTFYDLSMRVGDIPYSEALLGEEGIYYPAYDSQKDVFLGILKELETADSLFSLGRKFEGDPVYEGNPVKWQRAANNLSLKILLHLCKKTSDSSLQVVNRFRKIVSEENIMQSADDNYQLVFSDQEVEFYPFYNSNFRKYPVMSSTITDQMKRLNDYRLFYYAEPSDSLIAEGFHPSDWEAYAGVNPADDFSLINERYAARAISGINQRYYCLPQGEPMYVLSYQEQCFILAEAALRGWTDDDPVQHYQNGIRTALKFVSDNTPDDSLFHHGRRITETVIANYLAEVHVMLQGTTDEKLASIALQRYLMGFMQDGYNSYFEYRRTGYPVLPINELTNLNSMKDRIPVRWMYPLKELTYNRINLEKALQRQFQGSDDVNEQMWILRNE